VKKTICLQQGQIGCETPLRAIGTSVAKVDLAPCGVSFRMKKYLVYTYYVGRPLGGAKDFLDAFDSIEECLDNILNERDRYYQIIDRDTMETVKEGLAMFKDFAAEH
jgi:hypothetical protein